MAASVLAPWFRGVSVPHTLTPDVVYACTGGGFHAWGPLKLLAQLHSSITQWCCKMAIRYRSKAELKIRIDFLPDAHCFLGPALTFLGRFYETLLFVYTFRKVSADFLYFVIMALFVKVKVS